MEEEDTLPSPPPLFSPDSVTSAGGHQRSLVVILYGLRGLNASLSGKRLYCKLSLNSALKRTPQTRAVSDGASSKCEVDPPCQLRGWKLSGPTSLSFEDLLIVRVKCLQSIGRTGNVGSASIAIRRVSLLGTKHGRAWFPLSPYEDQKDTEGEICLGMYWEDSEEAEEDYEPDAAKHKSGKSEVSVASADSSEKSSTFKGMFGSPHSPRLSLGKPFGLSSSQRSTKSGSHVVGSRRLGVSNAIKSVMGLTVHKTQEMLIRSGVKKDGLTLDSAAVKLEGTWLDRPAEEEGLDEEVSESGTSFATQSMESFAGTVQLGPSSTQISLVTNSSFVDGETNPILASHSRPVLLIQVLEGRGLLAADANGLSDPYCILKLKTYKRKTKVKNMTLTPVWNEQFVFGGDTNMKESISLDDTLVIIVKDRDKIGFDDDLGMLQLPLWAIAPHTTTAGTVSTSSSTSGVTEGEGENEYGANKEEIANFVSEHDESESGIDEQSEGKVDGPRLPRMTRYNSINAVSINAPSRWYSLHRSPGMTTVRGEIKLRISYFCGNDLPSSPSMKNVTGGKKDTDLSGPAGFLKKIEGKAFKKKETPEEFDSVSSLTRASWLNRRRYCRSQTVLNVLVVQARNLIAADPNGKSDPYVIVQVRKNRAETSVKGRTLNPVWNEMFEFGRGQEFLTETDQIVITVRDHDRLLRDDELGEVTIPLWSILGSPAGRVWYALKSPERVSGGQVGPVLKMDALQDLGEIQLEFSFTVVGDGPHSLNGALLNKTSSLERDDSLGALPSPRKSLLHRPLSTPASMLRALAKAKQAQYKRYNGKVWFYKMHFHVISAFGLPPADEHGGISTYVTVSCGPKAEKTRVVKGSVNPIYKEKFVFTESAVPKAKGLCRQDRILVTIRVPNSERALDFLELGPPEASADKLGGQILAATYIDLGFIVDKMGYIDKDGMLLQSWFSLDLMNGFGSPRHAGGLEDGFSSLSVDGSEMNEGQVRLKLGIQLVPIAESRLMEHEKLVLRVNRAMGLDASTNQSEFGRNVFFRVRAGVNVSETSLCKMTHGHVVCHEEVYFDTLDCADQNAKVRVDVCNEDTGEPFATFTHSMQAIRENPEHLLEGWFPLEFRALQDHHQHSAFVYEVSSQDGPAEKTIVKESSVDMADEEKVNFARLSVDSPEIHLSVRLVKVMDHLEPILGQLRLNLAMLKMDTNDFNNNLRCVIKYDDKEVVTRTFRGVVNVQFDPERFDFTFPVRNMFDQVAFEVWNVPSKQVDGPSSTKPPKLLGSAKVNVFDIIENEAVTVFGSDRVMTPAESRPVKLKLTDPKGHKQGSLRLRMAFTENLVTGSLATHANPARHPTKPFSLANLRHEVNRSIALMKGFTSVVGSLGYVLGWSDQSSSAAGLGIFVLLCVLDFWTSRFLALFPFVGLIYMINRHRDRTFGHFSSQLLQKTGIGENDTKARLLVTVVKGRNLVAMDNNGKSDPLVNISILNGDPAGNTKVKEVRLGRTRTVYETLNPDWSQSPIGFKANPGTALIQWRSLRETSSGIPAFEYFLDRQLFRKPSLECVVVGTRGLTSSNESEAGPRVVGNQLVPMKLFRLVARVVPSPLLANMRRKANQFSSGKSFGSSGHGSVKMHHFRLSKQSSQAYPTLSGTPKNSSSSTLDTMEEETAEQIAKQSTNGVQSVSSGRLRKAFSSYLGPDKRGFRSVSSISSSSGAMHRRDAMYLEAIWRNLRVQDNTTCWLPARVDFDSSGTDQSEYPDHSLGKLREFETVVTEDDDADRGLFSRKAWLSSADKKFVMEILEGKSSSLPPEYHTTAVEASRNPKFNQRLIMGKEFLLDSDDIVVFTVRCGDTAATQVLAYCFVSLKIITSDQDIVNGWFPLEVPDIDGKMSPMSPDVEESTSSDGGDNNLITRWRIVGEILLSLRLQGTNLDFEVRGSSGVEKSKATTGNESVEKSPDHLLRRNSSSSFSSASRIVDRVFEESLVVSAARDFDEPDEPWSKSSAVVVFDVFDEDEFTRRDFIGRATIPLNQLVKDDRTLEQPVTEQWIPLTLRFDNSKADKLLWSVAQGQSAPNNGTFTRQTARIKKRKRGSLPRSWFGKVVGDSGSRQDKSEYSNSVDMGEEEDHEEQSEEGPDGQLLGQLNKMDSDLSFNWVNSSMPFGEILVRTQLVLSDPAAEEAYKAAEEAKKADKGGLIEQARVVFKTLKMVQDFMFGINNTLEQARNLFNWTHPRKTEFMMGLLSFLLVLFILVPSRYIILFVGIFFFTERFRPLGVMAIKFKHLIALLPSNDDLVRLYTRGALNGSLQGSKSSGGANAGLLAGSEGEDASKTGQVSRLNAHRFYQNMKDRYMTLGLRNQLIQNKSREAQESKYIVSETDCKAFGHLRLLQKGRGKTWRRYFFVIAHHRLMYWNEKDDFLVEFAQGGFGELTNVSIVPPNSADAQFLASKGVRGSTLECAFVITHPEKYRLRAVDEDGSDSASEIIEKIAQTANLSKRIRTFLVANSVTKRNYWVENLKTHCVTQSKVNKIL